MTSTNRIALSIRLVSTACGNHIAHRSFISKSFYKKYLRDKISRFLNISFSESTPFHRLYLRVEVQTDYSHNIKVDSYDLKPYVGLAFEREGVVGSLKAFYAF